MATQIVEAQAAEDIENVLLDTFRVALDKFQERAREHFNENGLSKESYVLAGLMAIEAETFVLESGLVDTIRALVATCDRIAAMSPADITDKALKRTLMRTAREEGIRISLAGDLAHKLGSANIEVGIAKMHAEYVTAKADLDTAARLALQYEGMKVPVLLKKTVRELRERLEAALHSAPHLAEQYKV